MPFISEGADIVYDYLYYQMIRMDYFLYKPEAARSVDWRFLNRPLVRWRLALWTIGFLII